MPPWAGPRGSLALLPTGRAMHRETVYCNLNSSKADRSRYGLWNSLTRLRLFGSCPKLTWQDCERNHKQVPFNRLARAWEKNPRCQLLHFCYQLCTPKGVHKTKPVVVSVSGTQMTCLVIDLLHKAHNAPIPYSTMHHLVTEMCTCMYISVAKCIVGYLSNALWD